jgi:hypothetical protein
VPRAGHMASESGVCARLDPLRPFPPRRFFPNHRPLPHSLPPASSRPREICLPPRLHATQRRPASSPAIEVVPRRILRRMEAAGGGGADERWASLCNCVVNFLLEERYHLTALELLQELQEDGRHAHALRLRAFFSDPALFPPDLVAHASSAPPGTFHASHFPVSHRAWPHAAALTRWSGGSLAGSRGIVCASAAYFVIAPFFLSDVRVHPASPLRNPIRNRTLFHSVPFPLRGVALVMVQLCSVGVVLWCSTGILTDFWLAYPWLLSAVLYVFVLTTSIRWRSTKNEPSRERRLLKEKLGAAIGW